MTYWNNLHWFTRVMAQWFVTMLVFSFFSMYLLHVFTSIPMDELLKMAK